MSLASITDKMRLIPRDFGRVFQAKVTGDGQTVRYDLPEDNVGIDAVYIAGTTPTNLTPAPSIDSIGTGQYYIDGRAGVITLGTPLASGAVLVVDGRVYTFLLPDDVSSYITVAFDMHTHGVVPMPTYDTLAPHEEYLVALLAAIEALWGAASEAAGEIDIMTPEGVQIPRSQRFAQIMSVIERLQAHYKELAAAFNVGPYRIQVLNLRRVSRTTGRLVPEYVEQEFDDRTFPPIRIFPPIDTGLV